MPQVLRLLQAARGPVALRLPASLAPFPRRARGGLPWASPRCWPPSSCWWRSPTLTTLSWRT